MLVAVRRTRRGPAPRPGTPRWPGGNPSGPRSARPGAYAIWEPDARQLVAALSGLTGALADCFVAVGPRGWVQPVRAPVVSGFRTEERPGHDGVDLGAQRGTRIVAASAGVGPHLHYEVHLVDHSPATAVDPVPFMAAHAAPLG